MQLRPTFGSEVPLAPAWEISKVRRIPLANHCVPCEECIAPPQHLQESVGSEVIRPIRSSCSHKGSGLIIFSFAPSLLMITSSLSHIACDCPPHPPPHTPPPPRSPPAAHPSPFSLTFHTLVSYCLPPSIFFCGLYPPPPVFNSSIPLCSYRKRS